jgi:hypothetical protein
LQALFGFGLGLVDAAKTRNYGILPRLWPLVALLAILTVIVFCASFAPVLLPPGDAGTDQPHCRGRRY